MSTQYFYRLPNGKVSGPLPLESIRTAVKVSRLPAETLVSDRPGEPWLDLDLRLPPLKIDAGHNPNLRGCPACGKEIASDAPSCPHCGKRFSTTVSLAIAVIIGLAIGVWLLSRMSF